MNRRNAMKVMAGVLLAPMAEVLPRKAHAHDFTGVVNRGAWKCSSKMRWRMSANGVTYFKAGEGRWPVKAKLFLDGRDVTVDAHAVDVVAGWVILLDRDPQGRREIPIRPSLHRGVLEIREPMGDGLKVTTADGISYIRTGVIRGLTA